ncbi:ABC transporter ATP-binding protein [Mycoplasmopsis gallinacea]|uniref:ATP-binding cassette domain-containing protein n=1 Tax=Mycoplasmopsis gallinacea TaxID=29556 RepID=A0A6H0V107_9BACT|nr:ABC transporter ATP-binding protein [Mycoplasmopsis gallinacea]QIW61882.1 ATP-binding cassette domain-containing protein [Mycoplasmopsis gallinacea]
MAFLQLDSKDPEVKNVLIAFLLISLFATISYLINEFFFLVSNYLLKKTILREMIDKLFSTNFAKWAFVPEQNKLVAFANSPDLLSKGYYLSFINGFIQLVSFLATLISLAIISPIVLAYILPLIIVALILPMLAHKKGDQLSYLNNQLMINPKKISSSITKQIFTHSINGTFENLEKSYKDQLNQEVVTNIDLFSKIYGSFVFWQDLISIIFSALVIVISLMIALFTPNLLAIALFGTILTKLPSFKSFIKETLGMFLNVYICKMHFKQMQEDLYSKSELAANLSDAPKEAPLNFEKLTLANATIISKETNETILENVSLSVNKNDKILIFGESGGGKSSLVLNLTGSMTVINESQIFINNKEVNNLDLLNQSYLTNEKESLFEGTLLENLTFFNDTLVNETKKLVKLFDLEKLDLNEAINIENLQYSHGQLQRILLIKAINSGKEILFFDESLSNIDEKTATEILKYLASLNKTVLVVSHNHTPEHKELFNKIWKVEKGVLHEMK